MVADFINLNSMGKWEVWLYGPDWAMMHSLKGNYSSAAVHLCRGLDFDVGTINLLHATNVKHYAKPKIAPLCNYPGTEIEKENSKQHCIRCKTKICTLFCS